MMPWKRKTAWRGGMEGWVRRVVMKAGEVMSPWRVVAWCGCVVFGGMVGGARSVRRRRLAGEVRRRAARRGPTRPAAPVMRMLVGVLVEEAILDYYKV
jgi:hypothetical protein